MIWLNKNNDDDAPDTRHQKQVSMPCRYLFSSLIFRWFCSRAVNCTCDKKLRDKIEIRNLTATTNRKFWRFERSFHSWSTLDVTHNAHSSICGEKHYWSRPWTFLNVKWHRLERFNCDKPICIFFFLSENAEQHNPESTRYIHATHSWTSFYWFLSFIYFSFPEHFNFRHVYVYIFTAINCNFYFK